MTPDQYLIECLLNASCIASPQIDLMLIYSLILPIHARRNTHTRNHTQQSNTQMRISLVLTAEQCSYSGAAVILNNFSSLVQYNEGDGELGADGPRCPTACSTWYSTCLIIHQPANLLPIFHSISLSLSTLQTHIFLSMFLFFHSHPFLFVCTLALSTVHSLKVKSTCRLTNEHDSHSDNLFVLFN